MVDNSNATVQALRTSGNTLTDVFTYTMTDTGGATSTTQITVTIQGANDAPNDITGTLTIAENSANGSVAGTVTGQDVDNGDSFTYSLTDTAGGRFAINSATGQITVADGSLLDFEANTSHTIVTQVTDTALATFSKTMTVSVTNVNEAPIAVADSATAVEAGGTNNGTAGTNPTGNVLTNDTDVDAGDTKTVTGVAAGVVGSASTNVGSAVTGTYGSINIAANGAYTYTVDNSNAAVQALRTTANTLQDVFSYTMRDTAGLTSTTQVTVTIQGANDEPVAQPHSAAIDANTVLIGQLIANDPDAGDTLQYSWLAEMQTSLLAGLPPLRIDFGADGPDPLQAGYQSFTTPANSTAASTQSFISDLSSGSGSVTLTISGQTHMRDYAAITAGDFVGLSALLSDLILRNQPGTMTLNVSGLAEGQYEVITYHHSTEYVGSNYSLTSTDANGTSTVVANSTATGGTPPVNIETNTFIIVVDATGTFSLNLTRLDNFFGQTVVGFNGIEIARTIGPVPGALTINTDGSYSYDSEGAFEFLGAGQT
jgi:VCBS repeat-containing protein